MITERVDMNLVIKFFGKNKRLLKLVPCLLILSLLVVGCAGPTFQGWSGFAERDGILYFGGINGEVYAIDIAARGQNATFPGPKEWVFTLPRTGTPGTICGPACAPAAPVGSIYATPVITGDLLCVGIYSGDTGRLVALNRLAPGYNEGVPQRSKGEWMYPSGANKMGAIVGSPVVIGNTLFVGSSDGKLYAIDAVYGEKKWDFNTGGKIWTSPVVDGDVVYTSNYEKKLFAVSSTDGSQIWSTELQASIASSPALSPDSIFVGAFNNHLYAIDRTTGKERWNFEGGNWFWSTPVVKDDTVYAGCLDDKVYAISANTGEQKWQFTANGPIVSTPVLADNLLAVASEIGDIYVIDADNGELVRSIHLGYQSKAPLLADGDTVFVHTGNFCVYSINVKTGEKTWEFCYSTIE